MTDEPRRPFVTLPRVTLVSVLLAIVVFAGMHWIAERSLILYILLFVPPFLIVAPFLILALLAAKRRRWRCAVANGGMVLLVGFGFYRYRLAGGSSDADGKFTVISHNIGQGNRVAFNDAFPNSGADAILLQDAAGRERDFSRRYPNLRMRGLNQFLLLTPHEIVEAAPVHDALWRGRPVAARFVVRVSGKEIALYNVHFPTPRRSLSHAMSPRVALGLEDEPIDGHASYSNWLEGRVTLAEQLAKVISQETLPFVVAGDFNTPDHGLVYRRVSEGLRDSHADVGSGWGFTFPGDGRKGGRLAMLFGPWLRLDYIFAGKGFTPIECRVASDDRSQHRAILARLAPLP
jgi:vancomycin resistance protein VanJ